MALGNKPKYPNWPILLLVDILAGLMACCMIHVTALLFQHGPFYISNGSNTISLAWAPC